jgi:hypothetical protein
MKNITKQYQDLLEGKMSKANFMVNVRRDFSQWISPVNTFDDAVRILKSKRIITESHEGNTQWMDGFMDDLESRNLEPREAAKVEKALDYLGGHKVMDMYGMMQLPYAVNAFLGDVDEILAHMRSAPPADPDIPYQGMTENAEEERGLMVIGSTQQDNYAIGKLVRSGDFPFHAEWNAREGYWLFPEDEETYDKLEADLDSIFAEKGINARFEGIFEASATLNEAEKKDPTIDQVDYIQLQRGTEFELSKMDYISDENYVKAKEKAHKALVKDPNAYRHLIVANYKEVSKKDKALQSQEVKKDNLTDKANQQKTIVKNVQANTKDTLGKQEKAKKGVPEGVKQLREAMLDEFTVVPERNNNFAVGHQVRTPEGKMGTIEELSQDNTATVKFDDDTIRDYQTNVLKPSSEKVTAPSGKAAYGKMSKEDLKEKLMKSLDEAGLFRLKNPQDAEKKKVPGVVDPDDTTEKSSDFQKLYQKAQ